MRSPYRVSSSWAASSTDWRRLFSTTLAPSSRNRRALALPMPPAPPVMSTTLSWNRISTPCLRLQYLLMQLYHGLTVTTRIAEDHLNAWRGLLNAHARLTSRIEAELADAGLPQLAWYDVLWALQRAPGKALRMGELAEAVTISRSGLTRLVDRIEADGLLERRPSAQDRRAIDVAITPDGSKLLRKMWPVYEGVLRSEFEDKLSRREAQALTNALAKV